MYQIVYAGEMKKNVNFLFCKELLNFDHLYERPASGWNLPLPWLALYPVASAVWRIYTDTFLA